MDFKNYITTTENTELTAKAEDPLTSNIIGAAIEVHRALGPGLLESAYEACLIRELCLKTAKSGTPKASTNILQRCCA
jgi:hypothetical protein